MHILHILIVLNPYIRNAIGFFCFNLINDTHYACTKSYCCYSVTGLRYKMVIHDKSFIVWNQVFITHTREKEKQKPVWCRETLCWQFHNSMAITKEDQSISRNPHFFVLLSSNISFVLHKNWRFWIQKPKQLEAQSFGRRLKIFLIIVYVETAFYHVIATLKHLFSVYVKKKLRTRGQMHSTNRTFWWKQKHCNFSFNRNLIFFDWFFASRGNWCFVFEFPDPFMAITRLYRSRSNARFLLFFFSLLFVFLRDFLFGQFSNISTIFYRRILFCWFIRNLIRLVSHMWAMVNDCSHAKAYDSNGMPMFLFDFA